MTMTATSLIHRDTVLWVAWIPLRCMCSLKCIHSWSETLHVISGVWDSCQDGIWQKEEGWGWCWQAGKWRSLHSSFPPARGQVLCILSISNIKLFALFNRAVVFCFVVSGPFSSSDVWNPSRRPEPEAGSLSLLGPLVQMVQVPTSGPHQGVLWRENCTLLCLAG